MGSHGTVGRWGRGGETYEGEVGEGVGGTFGRLALFWWRQEGKGGGGASVTLHQKTLRRRTGRPRGAGLAPKSGGPVTASRWRSPKRTAEGTQRACPSGLLLKGGGGPKARKQIWPNLLGGGGGAWVGPGGGPPPQTPISRGAELVKGALVPIAHHSVTQGPGLNSGVAAPASPTWRPHPRVAMNTVSGTHMRRVQYLSTF